MRILLVEDHEDTSEVVAHLLYRQGHDVVTAESAQKAQAFCDSEPFDILICDLMLPGEDGWELARIADKRGIPAIAVSALALPRDIERSQRAGFVTHLPKPVPFEDLERALYEAVRTYMPGLSPA